MKININLDDATKALKSGYDKAEKMLKDDKEIERLLQRLEKKMKVVPMVGNHLATVPLMVSLLRSYVFGDYKDIPIGSIIAIVSALVYFVSPIDLIPDVIPGAGHIDDGLVVLACWNLVKSDADEYKEWRKKNNKEI